MFSDIGLKATVANHGPRFIARTRRSQQLIHPGFGVRWLPSYTIIVDIDMPDFVRLSYRPLIVKYRPVLSHIQELGSKMVADLSRLLSPLFG